MINIVVVSHSARLAQGVEELAHQMMRSDGCKLALAAGVDDEEHAIGTDAIKVMAAIESVAEGATGIVVLMDLGSALLSAETALELLDPQLAARVTLCSAPLVEGTLAAVVAANSGGSLEQVLAEAQEALQGKQAQLGETIPASKPLNLPLKQGKSLSWKVQNPHGLHARPAARLAETLAPFDAELVLEKQGQCANPRSLNQLAMLQIRYGDTIRLIADGMQADEALAAFKALAEQHFGETVSEQQQPSLHGIPVEESISSGPIFHARSFSPQIVARQVGADDVLDEQQRLRIALQHTLSDLNKLADRASTLIGKPQAAIFGAHSMLLDDPDLQQAAYTRIAQQRCTAEQAWQQEMEQIAADYRALDDPYLRARELDVRDILRRTLSHLQQQPIPAITLNEASILVMDELMPSEVVMLDRRMVLGICLSGGNALSHTAILAKAMGIPMVVGMNECLTQTRSGQKAMLDAARGVLQLSH
ncbi:phosphocarrier protein HPr /phosphoenolpyruvate--protein phosphotransferase /dihydroxyacetone kinase DhaM subunit [Serratia fonticola]|uniref:phosphoenolpyruvate--glycerone phosphotransferase n=1 Tax=Serratia fonticola TaxID=47917 RepID=A0A542BUS3_SERFO|nr:dihydroxyacetone kinase phosphoryl donor subunit DhaM [Serratia fonticola]TQI82314.1 phosphocarrier protein HPr /phosphoenolpyruvate--protein phosphotransferase /dihydroxyacetone kinase DhaM subunit [Serratia fonticola]TQI95666.1 phosphocarrier protein HPr /phosphoenolpyruvate--protein phosphotransferase /dihydroxyacetone kinase DhaM subunit [Serratia fonticola]TVZ70162.1 phosphocarrier protein HPr /phosphoenolpyruvate--protein phosphotransferase /dihydroxyacetone kinase DhaM subunit [Serrati